MSTPLVHWYQRRRDCQELGRALDVELADIRDQAVIAAFHLRRKHGKFGRAQMQWTAHKLANSANEDSRQFATRLREQMKLPDEQLEGFRYKSRANGINTVGNAAQTVGTFMPPLEMPFLEAQLHKLTIFEPAKQQALLRTRMEVRIFNAQIEEVNWLRRLTFDGSLSKEHYGKVVGNLQLMEEKIALRAQEIVRVIERW